MQQIVRRRVVVESNSRIQFRSPKLREGTTAEVIVIVDAYESDASRLNDANELAASIAAYAAKHAGTAADLDSALEGATVQFLTEEPKGKRR